MLTAATMLKFAELALGILNASGEIGDRLAQLGRDVDRFKAEGRDPSEAEWAEIEGRVAARHERIQRA